MNVREAIDARHSVRAYTGEPVAKAVIEGLLAAAVQAPSGMNTQPWAFGVVEGSARLQAYSDRAKVAMLATITPGSPLERYIDTLQDPNFNIFYGAPALVIIYAKDQTPFAYGDCHLAAMTLLLAAVEQGLGSCWIGFAHPFLDSPEVKAEMGVPADYAVVAPLIIGHPAGPVQGPEKAPAVVVFWQG
jgi:nitroreductase